MSRLIAIALLALCGCAAKHNPAPVAQKQAINLADSIGPSPMDTTVIRSIQEARLSAVFGFPASGRRLRGIRDYESCGNKWRVYRWYYTRVTSWADWDGAHCDSLSFSTDEVEPR